MFAVLGDFYQISAIDGTGCTFFCYTQTAAGEKSHHGVCCRYSITSVATTSSLSKVSFFKKITLGKLLLICFIQNGSFHGKSLPHPSHFRTQRCWIYLAIHSLAMQVWLRRMPFLNRQPNHCSGHKGTDFMHGKITSNKVWVQYPLRVTALTVAYGWPSI